MGKFSNRQNFGQNLDLRVCVLPDRRILIVSHRSRPDRHVAALLEGFDKIRVQKNTVDQEGRGQQQKFRAIIFG